jgi:hypothetical protein
MDVLILPGLRRLMPVPYVYLIPDFGWLDKEQYKRFKASKKQAAPSTAAITNPIINRGPITKKAAPINQPTLF